MSSGLNKVWEQCKAFWAARTRSQQWTLVAGAVATAALLAFLTHLMLTPDYKPLMTGMEPADAQSVAAALTAKHVPNRISPDGRSISVPADQLDAARLDVASGGSQHSGRMGFEIFDKMSWGETEFDEKVNYQRALEGELERTMLTISGVKAARVHLVMATDSIFLDGGRSAKASVTLKLSGNTLPHDEVQAIQRLVAGAVDDLKPEDVAVIDADTGELLSNGSSSGPGGDEMARQLRQRILDTLAPVVGGDHIRASVNVEYDPGTTEESQDKYDPNVSVPLSTVRSDEETGAGAGATGVPGTASNVPQQGGKGAIPAVPATPGSGAETAKSENTTFGVNHTVIHSQEPAGRIRRVTAALLVDDAVTEKQLPKGKTQQVHLRRSPEELKQLQDLAEAAIGFDSTRGDVLTIEDMSFTRPVPIEPTKIPLAARLGQAASDYAAPVRYAGVLVLLLLGYFLMIRPMQKHVLSGARELGPGGGAVQAALPDGATPQIAGQAVEEESRTLALKEELTQLIKTEPAAGTRAVQAWLQGDGADR